MSKATILRFNLSPAHKSISLFIAALVFEQLFLRPLGHLSPPLQRTFLTKSSDMLSQRERWEASDLYELTHSLRLFYLAYQPPLTSDYFESMMRLLQVSLVRLMEESVGGEDSGETARHVEFLKEMYREFIAEQEQGRANSKQLLNRLTIGTGIKRNCDRFKSSISWVVYSSVLGVMLEFSLFKADSFFITSSLKYLTAQLGPFLHELIPKINSSLNASLLSFTASLSRTVLPVPGTPGSHSAGKPEEAQYRQVCEFIEKMYSELEKKHEKLSRQLANVSKEASASSGLGLPEKQMVRKVRENLLRCED